MADEAADELREFVDRVVDLAVYAPIGFLYEYPEVLPRLVAKGKSQVQLARVLAQMAARAAEPMMAAGVTEVGRAVGLAPPVPAGRSTAGRDAGAKGGSEAQGAPVSEADPEAAHGDSEARDVAPDEPWPGYDSMNVRDVVARFPHLDDDTREAVAAYEAANKGRATILRRV